MEVLVGPTFTIENPSLPTTTGQTDRRLFLNGINEVDQVPSTAFRRISEPPKFFSRGSSESSSSIGTPDDSDNDDEEVESDFNLKTTNANAFSSLDSLEDSLPIKKGLSSHFDGKSKSFTDLSKVNSLNELNKQESPFNKRRRVLIASKFSRITRSSFYSWSNPQSMPLLPLDEEDEDLDNNYYYEQDQEYKARKLPYASSSSSSSSLSEDKKQEAAFPQSHAAEMRLRLESFNSRSFSLADLKEHDDDDEDNDHED